MSAPKGHKGAVGAKHRCRDCSHPGGVKRRLNDKKASCSCACHQAADR